MKASLAAGLALVGLHALGFARLVHHCHGTELAVDPRTGTVPVALAPRVAIDDADGAPAGPGLHRRQWSVTYRGGFTRAVGAAQLVGPFQDPLKLACSGRVIVGQTLLAEIGKTIRGQLDAELRGESIFPIGAYERVVSFALRWATLAAHPEDRDMIGSAPDGYVRVVATLVFDRAEIPLAIALVPAQTAGALTFRVVARAELAFDNRVVQWISNRLRGDKLATRLAQRQIDQTLATTLAPPPPFQLPDGQTLRFTYCAAPPEIVEGQYGALPFAVVIGAYPTADVRPPRFGAGPRRPPPAGTTLALDLDLDALNALLYELWRSGFLDRRLADAGLDRRFNADPTVQQFLTLRLSPVRLALPPVIAAAPTGLRLSADARVAIGDGATVTTGRVWGGLDFRFAHGSLAAALGALELSCEQSPTLLVPCYADLVGALRDRGADLHGALTTAFLRLLSNIFVDRRLAFAGVPGELVIRGATPSVTLAPANATLHLDLDAALR